MSTFSLESPVTIRNHTVQLQVSFYGFSQFGKSDQCRTFLERLENFQQCEKFLDSLENFHTVS